MPPFVKTDQPWTVQLVNGIHQFYWMPENGAYHDFQLECGLLPTPSPLPHQCGPGSIPGPGVICGLSLLLVLSLLREVFLRVLRSSSHPLPPPPPVWPGFDSRTRRHMWVEFVVGSLLAPRGFSPGTAVCPSAQKPTFPNSHSI